MFKIYAVICLVFLELRLFTFYSTAMSFSLSELAHPKKVKTKYSVMNHCLFFLVNRKQRGRLKICSKSILFDPIDTAYPILKVAVSFIVQMCYHFIIIPVLLFCPDTSLSQFLPLNYAFKY